MGTDRLAIAGDWVDTGTPTMLLEAAATSAVQASNRILLAEGLRAEPLLAVPERGVLAGFPTPPKPPGVFFGPEPSREAIP
jgi:hypothetical protein